MSGIAAAAGVGGLAGAAGGSLALIAMAPLNAANNFIGSYYFGYGMIAGERDMYQEDWPKIKARLDKGEAFAAIWEEYVTRNTSGVMSNAGQIVIQVREEWNKIVFDYLQSLPIALQKALGVNADYSNLPDIKSRFDSDDFPNAGATSSPAERVIQGNINTQNRVARERFEKRHPGGQSAKDKAGEHAKNLENDVVGELNDILAEMSAVNFGIKSARQSIESNPKNKSAQTRNIKALQAELKKLEEKRKRWKRSHPDLVRKYKL